MLTDGMWLTQQEGLSKLKEIPEFIRTPSHIYIICRRPRITLDPNSFESENGFVRGVFKIHKKSSFESGEFLEPLQLENKVFLDCPYPYTDFTFYKTNNEVYSRGKVAGLAHCVPKMSNFLNLEVLYVGQSYGNQGLRLASERLQNHSTLQLIYYETMSFFPDKEIWLLLLCFKDLLMMRFDGTEKFAFSNEEDIKHTQRIIHTRVTEQQRINFTEAALIRYFEPPYNKIFKNQFPEPSHRTYSECYKLDFNAVSVEVETERIQCMLYSEKVLPKWIHNPRFSLYNSEERKSIFEL